MKEKFLSVFTSRWARIALPLLVLLAGLAITAKRMGPQKTTYDIGARLWVQQKIFFSGKETNGEVDSPIVSGMNALKTACEIIESEAVTKKAQEELQLKLGAAAPDIQTIQDGLSAEPVEGADIIKIKYTAPDADTGLAVMKAVINAFMEENHVAISEPLRQSKDKLEKQLLLAKEEYDRSKTRVKSFQDSTATVDLEGDVSSLTQQKRAMEDALEEAKHDRVALKSKLDATIKQLGFGPESVMAVEKISNDEIIRSLRESIAKTEVELIELRSKFQDEHPKVKRLKTTLEASKQEMQNRCTQLVGDIELKESFVAAANDETQKKIFEDMIESNTEIAALDAKISSLNESLGRIVGKLSVIPARQLQLADIKRGEELATSSLTEIEQQLQRLHLTETVATSSQEIQVIDQPAVEASNTTARSWTVGGVISAVASLAIAALQWFLLQKPVTAAVISRLTTGRVGGFIPPLNHSERGTTELMVAVDRIGRTLGDWFNGGATPVVVTSASEGDGKSTLAYALGITLADSGKKVVIIDADNKSPTIHRMAGISASPGLLQYLFDRTIDCVDILNAVKENATVIPVGGVDEHGAHILKHPRFVQLVNELAKSYDAIIIDSPDSGASLNSLVAPQFPCKWLAVFRIGATMIAPARNMATQLDLVAPGDTAVVVNCATLKDIQKLKQPAEQPLTPQTQEGSAVVAAAAPGPDVESTAARW
jgi:Mrp family chromosome partitioning ATPase/capsular polysaccharide biosynthesis protein